MIMTPDEYIQFGFGLLNLGIDFIKKIKAEHGMTDEQLAAAAETQDLANKEDIKKLLAL